MDRRDAPLSRSRNRHTRRFGRRGLVAGERRRSRVSPIPCPICQVQSQDWPNFATGCRIVLRHVVRWDDFAFLSPSQSSKFLTGGFAKGLQHIDGAAVHHVLQFG